MLCNISENCAVLFFLFLILIIRYQLFKKLMSKIWFNIVLKKIDVKKTYNISGFMNDVKILMLYLVYLVVYTTKKIFYSQKLLKKRFSNIILVVINLAKL